MVSKKIRFREDIREKRDSTQYPTVGKLKCPKIQIGLTLRGVKQFYLIFENFNIQDF